MRSENYDQVRRQVIGLLEMARKTVGSVALAEDIVLGRTATPSNMMAIVGGFETLRKGSGGDAGNIDSVIAKELERFKARDAHNQQMQQVYAKATRRVEPFAFLRQEAVGHGGFHWGAMGVNGPLLRWVYDCGSWRKSEILKQRVTSFLKSARMDERSSDVDFLFVSHFDSDHVNGLECLFAGADGLPTVVDTVIAPYLGPLEIFVALGREIARNRCTPTVMDAIANPARYFGQRGVRNLVLLRPDDPAPEPEPEPPAGGPFGPREGGDADGLISATLYGSDGKRIQMPFPDDKNIGVVEAEPGAYVDVSTSGRPSCWMFLPHAREWEFNRRELAARVKRYVGLDPSHPNFVATLTDHLSTKKGLAEVKKVYCGINSNGTSMSLYVGPMPTLFRHPSDEPDRDRSGWLLTGDAPLSQRKAFASWRQSFEPIASEVGWFMVPHHGAQANFNKEILTFIQDARPFVTVDKKDYKHRKRPHKNIRRNLKGLVAVTERTGLSAISILAKGRWLSRSCRRRILERPLAW